MEATTLGLGLVGARATRQLGRIEDKFVDDIVYPYLKRKFEQLSASKPKHKAKKGLALLQEIKQSENYNSFINEVYYKHLHIKTMSIKKTNVYIDDIYVDLLLDKENGIEELINLKDGLVYCVEGIAGQGKSTFMKKLLLNMIKKTDNFPIFIEIRNLKESNIISYISNILSRHEIKHGDDDIISLLQSGKVPLILDGFDELTTEQRERLNNDIENISIRYNCSIIVSTRPDTEICSSYMVLDRLYKIQHLESESVFKIVEKISEPDQIDIIKNILRNNEELMESLKTPILVSLFCFCHPYSDIIPENASEYYSRIFDIVYEGHDKRKDFFQREKKYKVKASEAKKIFNAFSYITNMHKKTSFDKNFAIEKLSKCLDSTGNKDKHGCEDDIFHDIVNVTSLIIDDGMYNYSYIHRTIQEYHAALFVKEASQTAKEAYQEAIVKKLLSGELYFTGITTFLMNIDGANSIKKILTPIMTSLKIECIDSVTNNIDAIMDDICTKTEMNLISHIEESTKIKKGSRVRETYKFGMEISDIIGVCLVPFLGVNFIRDNWVQGLITKKIKQPHMEWFVTNIRESANSRPEIISREGTQVIKRQSYEPISIKNFLVSCNLYDEIRNELNDVLLSIVKTYEEWKEKSNDEDIVLI